MYARVFVRTCVYVCAVYISVKVLQAVFHAYTFKGFISLRMFAWKQGKMVQWNLSPAAAYL